MSRGARQPRLGERYFALVMRAWSWLYERQLGHYRRMLLAQARGTVVELGPGTGPNLRHLPPAVRWIGVEPNPAMIPLLEREAARLGVPIGLLIGTAAELELPSRSVDTVVSTLVLCSVPDVAEVLREVRRVLRPGGRLIYLEHTRAPRGSLLAGLQRWLAPVWSALADGCRPDRDIAEALSDAGFQAEDAGRFTGPWWLMLARPHVCGCARATTAPPLGSDSPGHHGRAD